MLSSLHLRCTISSCRQRLAQCAAYTVLVATKGVAQKGCSEAYHALQLVHETVYARAARVAKAGEDKAANLLASGTHKVLLQTKTCVQHALCGKRSLQAWRLCSKSEPPSRGCSVPTIFSSLWVAHRTGLPPGYPKDACLPQALALHFLLLVLTCMRTTCRCTGTLP